MLDQVLREQFYKKFNPDKKLERNENMFGWYYITIYSHDAVYIIQLVVSWTIVMFCVMFWM